MTCKIGITTNTFFKKRNWESLHPEMDAWEILGQASCEEDAKKIMRNHADLHGCEEVMPSAEPEGESWFIYHFELT